MHTLFTKTQIHQEATSTHATTRRVKTPNHTTPLQCRYSVDNARSTVQVQSGNISRHNHCSGQLPDEPQRKNARYGRVITRSVLGWREGV